MIYTIGYHRKSLATLKSWMRKCSLNRGGQVIEITPAGLIAIQNLPHTPSHPIVSQTNL